LLEFSFAVPGGHPGERIEGTVEAQKSLKDRGKQEDASAGIFGFIEFDAHIGAPAKGDAGFRNNAADRGFAIDG
jgi:hypothetical protein